MSVADAADEDVAAVGAGEAVEFADREGGGGVDVVGVEEPQDDDLDGRGVHEGADLVLEDVGGAEEEVALDVDDRDGVAGLRGGLLGEFAALVEVVLDELGAADLLEEQDDRDADPDVDRLVERQEQAAGEGDQEGGGVGLRDAGGRT